MKQELMSIYEFSRGDLITRIQPIIITDFENDEEYKDRSFMGIPLTFLGIANGCIYVERENPLEKNSGGYSKLPVFLKMLMINDGPINLPLDLWSEGWSYYIDPYSLGENDKNKKDFIESESLESLQKKLNIALENEEYEKAEKIKKIIAKKKIKDE